MPYVLVCIVGYAVGCLNPAYVLGKLRGRDLRREGTGNLGATNTGLTLGRWYGIAVMAFDVLKSFIVVRICRALFPARKLLWLIAGIAVIIGHNFPFYLSFKGGKGLASFAGLILATDLRTFFILLIIGAIVVFITDYICSIAFSSAILYPFVTGWLLQSVQAFFVACLATVALLIRHYENWKRIQDGTEARLRTVFKKTPPQEKQ